SSGIVRAEGAQGNGGNVQILGDHVGLMGSALVDANGRSGGGTVLIGGDFQGKNPNVQNASRTFVSADARIQADALNSGSGGKVVIWANEFTRFLGTISAKGINAGGSAEVSGSGTLAFDGNVDLNSKSGGAGNLLLDPKNIIIAASD